MCACVFVCVLCQIAWFSFWHARISASHFYKVSHGIFVDKLEKCGLDDKTLMWTLKLPIFCSFLDTKFSGRQWQSGFSSNKMARMTKNLVILSWGDRMFYLRKMKALGAGGKEYASVIEWNECSLGGNQGSNHESSLLQNALCHPHVLTMLCIVTAFFCNSIYRAGWAKQPTGRELDLERKG